MRFDFSCVVKRELLSQARDTVVLPPAVATTKAITAVRRLPQSNQSAGPVSFLIFCSISIFLLASLVAGRRHQCT